LQRSFLKLFLIGACAVCSFTPTPSFGQGATGSILGNVTDTTGAVMPSITVRATNTLTGQTRSITSDEAGSYCFEAFQWASIGSKPKRRDSRSSNNAGIVLDVNRNARVDVKLEIGRITEKLEVVGDAALVDTQEVQAGGLVDSRRTVDLPVNGRNVLLALLDSAGCFDELGRAA
jgi:hypothetical protein